MFVTSQNSLLSEKLGILKGPGQIGHPRNGAHHGPFLVFQRSRAGGSDGSEFSQTCDEFLKKTDGGRDFGPLDASRAQQSQGPQVSQDVYLRRGKVV